MPRAFALGALATVLTAACGGTTSVQPTPSCRDDMDCPGGYLCLPADGGRHCLAQEDGGPPPPPPGTPALTLGATRLDFGNPLLGVATTRELTVTNTGDADLLVYDLQLVEDDALAEFVLGDPGPLPLVLAPGASRALGVTLVPSDAEVDEGYLLIAANDPAHAATLVPLVSSIKGAPLLEACVQATPAPAGPCADPTSFAFGAVDYGATVELTARLRNVNEGNAPLSVTLAAVPEPPAVPTALFARELFTLEEDAQHPGTLVEAPAALPYLLGPQGSTPDLYVRLTFTATIDRPLPDVVVALTTASPAEPVTTIPITWTIVGCPDGWRDLDDAVAGCEYRCPVWPTVAETCNDLDDDCDGEVDESFDLTSDEANCGYCGHSCALPHAAAECQSSICTITACTEAEAGGWANVNGTHADGCEYACPVWPKTVEACNVLDDDCDGLTDEDFNFRTDPHNCGTCGHDCPTQGLVCSNSECVLTCPPGTTNCSGACVDTTIDPSHCGTCAIACSYPHAAATCISSTCVMGACAAGYANLDRQSGTGCEYQCPVWPVVAETCNDQDDDCDGDTDETFDKQNDPLNCNACGTVCSYPHARGLCTAGVCQMGACLERYRDLANGAADGCEYQCPVWPPTTETCNGADDNCDGNPDENFDKQNDPQNCGGCGEVCSYPHAQALCVAGQCRMGACLPGYRDVTNGATDGCEYQCPVWPPVDETCNDVDDDCDGLTDESFDFVHDPLNCGSCGRSCAVPGAQVECRASACAVVGCLATFYDTDDDLSNGCEYECAVNPPTVEVCDGIDNNCDGYTDEGYDKQTDPRNCGACGTVCGANQICCAGGCVDSNEANCGYCGRLCDVGVSCFSGSCIDDGIIIVTELMIDPNGVNDTVGEYVEVFNTTAYPINLRGWRLFDRGSDSHYVTDDVWVPATGFAVLGVNANYASNGGVSVDYQYSNFSLGNSGDEVLISAGGTVVHQLPGSGSYASGFDSVGVSQQLDPDHFAAVLNADLTRWCNTALPIHKLPNTPDLGTPNAPNEQCP